MLCSDRNKKIFSFLLIIVNSVHAMIIKRESFYIFLGFASLAACFVFAFGFFPENITKIESETSSSETFINRSILMIIDALRLDFIEKDSFPYLHQLIEQNEACVLKMTTHLPTLTQPRIKVIRYFLNLQ